MLEEARATGALEERKKHTGDESQKMEVEPENQSEQFLHLKEKYEIVQQISQEQIHAMEALKRSLTQCESKIRDSRTLKSLGKYANKLLQQHVKINLEFNELKSKSS